jgi:hypothetical protein
MRTRFELFAGLSLAAHVAVFTAVASRRPPRVSESGTGSATGASAAIGGDTFEVPEVEDLASGEAASEESPALEIDEAEGALARPSRAASPHSASRASHRAAAPPPEPAAYGAVGDRAAGDLVTTFRRAFATAASADPLWNGIPVGFYADGDVTFALAPDGSLTDTTVSATAAPAFRAAVLRTAALLRHRLFTAQGATTRTHMVVRVSDRLVNHGAFTIDATGSFELPSGRHVSVAVTVR